MKQLLFIFIIFLCGLLPVHAQKIVNVEADYFLFNYTNFFVKNVENGVELTYCYECDDEAIKIYRSFSELRIKSTDRLKDAIPFDLLEKTPAEQFYADLQKVQLSFHSNHSCLKGGIDITIEIVDKDSVLIKTFKNGKLQAVRNFPYSFYFVNNSIPMILFNQYGYWFLITPPAIGKTDFSLFYNKIEKLDKDWKASNIRIEKQSVNKIPQGTRQQLDYWNEIFADCKWKELFGLPDGKCDSVSIGYECSRYYKEEKEKNKDYTWACLYPYWSLDHDNKYFMIKTNDYLKEHRNEIKYIEIMHPSDFISELKFDSLNQLQTIGLYGGDIDYLDEIPQSLLTLPSLQTVILKSIYFLPKKNSDEFKTDEYWKEVPALNTEDVLERHRKEYPNINFIEE